MLFISILSNCVSNLIENLNFDLGSDCVPKRRRKVAVCSVIGPLVALAAAVPALRSRSTVASLRYLVAVCQVCARRRSVLLTISCAGGHGVADAMLACQGGAGGVSDVAGPGRRGANKSIANIVIIETTLSIRVHVAAWSRVALVRGVRALMLLWMMVVRALLALLVVIVEVGVHG